MEILEETLQLSLENASLHVSKGIWCQQECLPPPVVRRVRNFNGKHFPEEWLGVEIRSSRLHSPRFLFIGMPERKSLCHEISGLLRSS
jgi:hypothetical protein